MRWITGLSALVLCACVQRMAWEETAGEARLRSLPIRQPIHPRPGEVLRYGVRVGALPAAEIGTRVRDDQGVLHLEIDGRTHAWFDWIYSVELWGRTRLDGSGLPAEFEVRSREQGFLRERRVRLEGRPLLWWREGSHAAQVPVAVDATEGIDPLTFLWRLRQLAAGDCGELEVIAGKSADCYRVESLGRRHLATDGGEIACRGYRVQIRPIESRAPERCLGPVRAVFEVWLRAEGSSVPVLFCYERGLFSVRITLQEEVAGGAALTAAAGAPRAAAAE